MEKFKQVLDAGCSNGNYALEVAETFPDLQVTAIDIKDQFPDPLPPNVNFRQQDLMTLKETDIYDFIYSIDVLEHIKGNITAMENLSRALKPGGFLFIHIPNDKNNKHILPGKFFTEFDQWAAKEHVGEQYTPDELSQILKDMGFTIVGSKYTFGFTGKLAWEIDRICERSFKLKILFMPVLKFLAWLSVTMPHGKGSTLVLAKKTHP
ncbi:MAG: class I SAM-dependent methyltransferase [Candidatus Aminicenantes bacterium]|nr:MAG: class I SAM-dependent methyltransferase [Candidatus Aminicenantes bacterium]